MAAFRQDLSDAPLARQAAWIHRDGGADAGGRHRGQRGDLLARQRRAPQAAAVCGACPPDDGAPAHAGSRGAGRHRPDNLVLSEVSGLLRENQRGFASTAAFTWWSWNLTGSGSPSALSANSWSPRTSTRSGLAPHLGRTFSADEAARPDRRRSRCSVMASGSGASGKTRPCSAERSGSTASRITIVRRGPARVPRVDGRSRDLGAHHDIVRGRSRRGVESFVSGRRTPQSGYVS